MCSSNHCGNTWKTPFFLTFSGEKASKIISFKTSLGVQYIKLLATSGRMLRLSLNLHKELKKFMRLTQEINSFDQIAIFYRN